MVGLRGLTHIILTQVYSFAPNSDSDVYSVINQQGHSIGLGDTVQLSRRVHQGSGVAGLVPILHYGHT